MDRTDLFDCEGSLEMMGRRCIPGWTEYVGSDQFRVLPNVYGALTHGSLGGQIYNDGTNRRMYLIHLSRRLGSIFWTRWDFHWKSWFTIHRPRRRNIDGRQYSGGHFGAFTFGTPVDYLVLDDDGETVWSTMLKLFGRRY